MPGYFIEPRTRKFIKGYGFLSFATNLTNKYGKQLLDTATKTALNASKTDEFTRNKITDKILKSKALSNAYSRNIQ